MQVQVLEVGELHGRVLVHFEAPLAGGWAYWKSSRAPLDRPFYFVELDFKCVAIAPWGVDWAPRLNLHRAKPEGLLVGKVVARDDDASIAVRLGEDVLLVEGDARDIKMGDWVSITFEELTLFDMDL